MFSDDLFHNVIFYHFVQVQKNFVYFSVFSPLSFPVISLPLPLSSLFTLKERAGREERKRETREGGRLHEVVKTKLQFSVICSFIVNLLKDHLSMSVASSIMTRQLYPAGPPAG